MEQFRNVQLQTVVPPCIGLPDKLPEMPRELYSKRLKEMTARMNKQALDVLVIYSDREHFMNFQYVVGFDTRFEEGILVLHKDSTCYCLLGNECYSLHKLAQIEVKPVLCQQLSLPNQPYQDCIPMAEVFNTAGITAGMHVGMIGWKLFPEVDGDTDQFCVPSFIVEGVKSTVAEGSVVNAIDIFISPKNGLRTICDEDEIAFYEFGAAMASQSEQNIMDAELVGQSEIEIANEHRIGGLPMSCHPILSVGENTKKGLVSPTTNVARLGDPIGSCVGLRGGLTSRNGYIANGLDDLSPSIADFVERHAAPYFAAVVAWYEKIGIGVDGDEIFRMVDTILPQKQYGWVLNPGHLIADEEWLCSPIYPGSNCVIKSGMLIQMDIIPSGNGEVSPGCEDGVCIADEGLQIRIKEKYPSVYERMMGRRKYMMDVIGINLKPEVLPLSNIAGYYRPYFLNHELAFVAEA